MSIVDEITRLTSAKADIKAAIEAKGVTVPSSAHLDAFPSYVSAISGGGGASLEDELLQGTLSGSYSNSRVTTLRAGALRGLSVLGRVDLPNVTSLTLNTFRECKSLSVINLPALKSTGSGYNFYGCNKLQSAYFPLLTSVASYDFYACYGAMDVSIPKATRIDTSAFQACSALKGVYAPEVLTISASAFANAGAAAPAGQYAEFYFPKCYFIGSNAFSGGTQLQRASMYFGGESTTASVYQYAFYNAAVASFAFPGCRYIGSSAFNAAGIHGSIYFKSVYSINSNAFSACGLQAITIASHPSGSVTNIKGGAFYSCTQLESVYLFHSSVCTLAAGAFSRTPIASSSYLGYFGSIFVRASLLSAYQTATNWAAYSSRIVGLTDAEVSIHLMYQ